ncbi:caffeine-induced death protein 2, partial [Geopyxis carbonaria]
MSESQAAKVDHPPLSPQLCFSTRTLKAFLRISRGTIDDTITQNLNALSTPASQKFDASSTSRRTVGPVSKALSNEACGGFIQNVLMPSWQSRSDVLNYCASVATSTDPNDPDSLKRISENEASRERIIDERLDPYSGRYFPKESRTEILAQVIRNERMVENIIRDRTWRTVKERCGDLTILDEDWQSALDTWR